MINLLYLDNNDKVIEEIDVEKNYDLNKLLLELVVQVDPQLKIRASIAVAPVALSLPQLKYFTNLII